MIQPLFEFKFANNTQITVTENGFVLRDLDVSNFIIDASTLVTQDKLHVKSAKIGTSLYRGKMVKRPKMDGWVDVGNNSSKKRFSREAY